MRGWRACTEHAPTHVELIPNGVLRDEAYNAKFATLRALETFKIHVHLELVKILHSVRLTKLVATH